jgi:tyrosyl-tRNA synthetase
LIRRKANGDAYALTTRLITKADGTKFGKTEGGNVWLDPAKTSPYKFYQYWLNVSDEDAASFIKIFTQLSKEETEALAAEHAKAPHLRSLQQALAKDITRRVHSESDLAVAIKASSILFGNSTTKDLQELDENTLLNVLEGVPQVVVSKDVYAQTATITDLLSEVTKGQIFSSKGEARKMILGGGVSINKEKVSDATGKLTFSLLHNRYLLVQKGKKNYYFIILK